MLRFLLPLVLSAAAVRAEELVFTAMGCGPYTPADEVALVGYMKTENEEMAAEFIVHLGDIFSGKTARETVVGEDAYAKVRGYLTEGNGIPTYIVPGDNEWNDMPDPGAAWQWWTRQFLRLENHFQPEWTTEIQDVRPENFAFVRKGVLVIGINLVGGRVHDQDEWTRRFAENNAWMAAQFGKHGSDIRAAVVLCQANPIGFGAVSAAVEKTFGAFNASFARHASAFGKPVLFLHSDGHVWTEDRPWKEAPNVTRVQVDLLTPRFPPLRVTVRDGEKAAFAFDRRLPKSTPE